MKEAEKPKRCQLKKRYSSLHYANWIYSCRKILRKKPHSYQGCCCSELWPLGISFCFTIKPWILGATESYVLQQMLTHATQYFTFSFSPLLKRRSCLPLSSERPFFLFQKSKLKYLKMEEGESGWKKTRNRANKLLPSYRHRGFIQNTKK